MPLSEHEQRMLDQIESALYAEDPKFASTVRGKRMGGASQRRKFQAAALFVIGLALLIAGVALPVKPGGFPIISLVGFLVMFGAGVFVLMGGRGGRSEAAADATNTESPSAQSGSSGRHPRGARGPQRQTGFTRRMEDRFRRRFEEG